MVTDTIAAAPNACIWAPRIMSTVDGLGRVVRGWVTVVGACRKGEGVAAVATGKEENCADEGDEEWELRP
eukprot:6174766-Pleurochrysis_carterae.AAC.1